MNLRAGDAGVRVQQWAAQDGGPVPTPSEGVRAGTILTDEIKRSAVTETPSNLIETYNKANDSYRKQG